MVNYCLPQGSNQLCAFYNPARRPQFDAGGRNAGRKQGISSAAGKNQRPDSFSTESAQFGRENAVFLRFMFYC